MTVLAAQLTVGFATLFSMILILLWHITKQQPKIEDLLRCIEEFQRLGHGVNEVHWRLIRYMKGGH